MQIRLSGAGGQGVILLGIILADSAIESGYNAIQSQSYGPEARGGASKCEVIISQDEIFYPKVRVPDLLLALTQDSYDKYSSDDKYYETWIELLKKEDIPFEDIALFYTTQSDRGECLKFIDYVYEKYEVLFPLIETNTVDKLVEVIEGAEVVISGRMHALILGLSYKKKIITYKISKKIEEFHRMFCGYNDIDKIQCQIIQQIETIL